MAGNLRLKQQMREAGVPEADDYEIKPKKASQEKGVDFFKGKLPKNEKQKQELLKKRKVTT